MPDGKRITLVTDEILGVVRTGGAGTANTFLAFALARLGHNVEVLLHGLGATTPVDNSWAEQYSARGIRIRRVDPARERVGHAFASTYAVQESLKVDTPELVVAHDCYAPGYASLRLRELGLAFPGTAFAIYCHGTTGWTYEAHRKLRRWPPSFEFQALERASVELADVVVSPSNYMLDWMRGRGWHIRRPVVAPYFTRSAIDGAIPSAQPRRRIRRLVFFGRLEERKGIEPFIAAVNGVKPDLLSEIELVFLGRDTPLWPVARVSDSLTANVASVRFETELDQPEAISLLRQPGTLAVMPSLVDNSPNVIYECLEHGIPFLAGDAGGGPELVADDDRGLSFVPPTESGIRAGIEHALSAADGVPSPRASFAADDLFRTWEEVVASTVPTRPAHRQPRAKVSVMAHEQLREELRPTAGDFVLLRSPTDELDADCVETLLGAAGCGADVVTCGVRNNDGEVRLFVGEARELGLIGNYYGLVGLYRRSVLEQLALPEEFDGDLDWPLLVNASVAGAKIVSVPLPLVTSERHPGKAGDGSRSAFAVLQAFEQSNRTDLRDLPWLAASLAAVRATSAQPGTVRPALARLRRFRKLGRVESHTA